MAAGGFIYGRRPIEEQLRARADGISHLYVLDTATGKQITTLVASARSLGVVVSKASKKELLRIVGQVTHQGVVARIAPFRYTELHDLLEQVKAQDKPALFVVLDQIQDPGNVGSIIRSACALGADGLIIGKDRACDVTAAVVKSSAGATSYLPIAKVTNIRQTLELFKDVGIWVLGTVAEGDQAIGDIDLHVPLALVVGAEGAGMRQKVQETCDYLAVIPMSGAVGSLNAGVAAAIALYEIGRQRGSVDLG